MITSKRCSRYSQSLCHTHTPTHIPSYSQSTCIRVGVWGKTSWAYLVRTPRQIPTWQCLKGSCSFGKKSGCTHTHLTVRLPSQWQKFIEDLQLSYPIIFYKQGLVETHRHIHINMKTCIQRLTHRHKHTGAGFGVWQLVYPSTNHSAVDDNVINWH